MQIHALETCLPPPPQQKKCGRGQIRF
uniref:Uncharacterized protein n=1 Tax=Rhizophora mucronata TaxID=61149 RepID=A0A2P2QHF1_RHIMU